MKKRGMSNLVFVDCEAYGPGPLHGTLTEFGAVHYESRATFHGLIYRSRFVEGGNGALEKPTQDDLVEEAESVFGRFDSWLDGICRGSRLTFVSDNPAFDWQWINDGLWEAAGRNLFGFSARRIGDFYAGLKNNWYDTQGWKRFRVTPHDHNPVNDALGNVEAFERILRQASGVKEETSDDKKG